jgi:hypothetical protein
VTRAVIVNREPGVQSCLTDTIPSHPLSREFLRRRIPCSSVLFSCCWLLG